MIIVPLTVVCGYYTSSLYYVQCTSGSESSFTVSTTTVVIIHSGYFVYCSGYTRACHGLAPLPKRDNKYGTFPAAGDMPREISRTPVQSRNTRTSTYIRRSIRGKASTQSPVIRDSNFSQSVEVTPLRHRRSASPVLERASVDCATCELWWRAYLGVAMLLPCPHAFELRCAVEVA